MSKIALEMLITLLIGSTIVVNGITVNAEDIISDARQAANGANVHQLQTALALYYFDRSEYPDVTGGDALAGALTSAGYIQPSDTFDSSPFDYATKDGGQDYTLSIKS